jgi:hypothetical protein
MNPYVVIALVVVVMLSSAAMAYSLQGDAIGEPCALAPALHNCRAGLICDHDSGTCQKLKPHQEPNSNA